MAAVLHAPFLVPDTRIGRAARDTHWSLRAALMAAVRAHAARLADLEADRRGAETGAGADLSRCSTPD